MSMKKMLLPLSMFAALAAASAPLQAMARSSVPATTTAAATDDTVMLTVHFRHDQSRTLGELREQLDRQGFYKAFPPKGVEVVSWNVAMGIGQVVVLRLPASRLAEVNLAVENTAWGVYTTQFFPTYDLMDIAQQRVREARATP